MVKKSDVDKYNCLLFNKCISKDHYFSKEHINNFENNISIKTRDSVYTLLNFSLDNSYFQYNDKFYKQTTGGPMGSPLTVTLAEIRVTETKQLALETSSQPPKHY